MNKKIYGLLVTLIVVISFRFYSALYYPLLNSDHAVNILMIHDFRLPENFYFWGQDRIGSLIPLLGQPFFKLLHWSGITTESIVHYTILLAGFLAFASFFNSRFFKIIFAIIWFLPPMRFIDVIELYSGIEYSLIALACYFFQQLSKEKNQRNKVRRHIILFTVTLFLITAVWVSDMAIISVAVLLLVQSFFFLKARPFSYTVCFRAEVLYAIGGIVAAYFLFHYAKAHSPNPIDYATFGDMDSVRQSFSMLWQSVVDLFMFRGDELFTSIYLWLLMLTGAFLIIILRFNRPEEKVRKWIVFFMLDTLLVFLVIMLSRWTLLNGVPRRYFTCTYISLSMGLLLILDHAVEKVKYTQVLKTLLLSTVLLGGAGTVYNMKYFWPRTLVPKVRIASEFRQLGKIGLIAEYWNAYIVACTDPENIKATPHDKEQVRNPEMADAVFRQKHIYIIKDMWLESFPDSLKQFDRMLIKDGNAFRIGDCEVCKYRKAE